MEREHDTQRSKTGVIGKSSDTGDVVILSAQERRKIEVFEIMCLRNVCGIRRVDRIRNSLIRERCELSVLERMEGNVFKWFGHVERMGRKVD